MSATWENLIHVQLKKGQGETNQKFDELRKRVDAVGWETARTNDLLERILAVLSAQHPVPQTQAT